MTRQSHYEQLKPGAMVQIWDEGAGPSHGKLGYIVKPVTGNRVEPVYEVICFDDRADFRRYYVHPSHLRPIESSADVLYL